MFTLGYECGTIATLMESGYRFAIYTMHKANIDHVKIIAKAKHYQCEFEDVSEEWVVLTAIRIGAN